MTIFRATVLILGLSLNVGFASIDYLEQRFIEEDTFTRITEYFNGVEVTGDKIIIRSDPASRTGHYVSFELSEPYLVDHFKLEVYEFASRKPTEYLFQPEFEIEPSKPIYLGLTGEKWSEKSKPPVAYN
jgi:hypothetical protein